MAEMQNTGNPIGSNDLKDLSDNLSVLDRQLNSEELTTTDRFGNVIPTVAGMRKTMEDLASQIATNELVPIDGSRSADKLSIKDSDSSLELKAESGELKVGDKTALVASTVNEVKTIDEPTNFTGTLQQNGSGVITKSMNAAYITETFLSEDGLSWYRKYSDGFIEQKFNITAVSSATKFNLLTPFANSGNFAIGVRNFPSDSDSGGHFVGSLATKTTVRIKVDSDASVTNGTYSIYTNGY